MIKPHPNVANLSTFSFIPIGIELKAPAPHVPSCRSSGALSMPAAIVETLGAGGVGNRMPAIDEKVKNTVL